MKRTILSGGRIWFLIQAFLMYAWLSNLIRAASELYVYIGCAIGGILCLCSNQWVREKTPEGNRIVRGLVCACFGITVVLRNLSLFEPVTAMLSVVHIGCCLFGGYLLSYNVLLAVERLWRRGGAWAAGNRGSGCFLMLQVCAVYFWLSNLAKTDSRFAVYILCAVVGLICICHNYKTIGIAPPSWRNEPWLPFFAGLFSFGTLLANYPLFSPITAAASALRCVLGFLGGFSIGYHVLLLMTNRLPLQAECRERQHPVRVFLLAAGSIALIDLLYLLFVLYPGVLTRDSFSTMAQIMGDQAYNNTMPFWHTITAEPFIKLGLAVFGDINAAVAVFHAGQILFMAACFGCVIVTLYQIGVSAVVIILVYGLYAFLPYNIVYSVTLWKDVPFSGAALLFITGLYRLLRNTGRSRLLNYGMLLVGALGFSLWRTNGWYAFLATVLVMLPLIGKRRRRLLLVMVLVLIFCWIMINPVLDGLGVSSTNPVEAFAVPMQQIARVVAQDRPLTEYERSLLSEIFWLDKVKPLYDPQTVDPVKFETFRYDKVDFIRKNLGEYLGLYLQLAVKYPGDFLQAWIEETKGYWNGGYEFWQYTLNMGDDTYGIARRDGNPILSHLYASAFRLLNETESVKAFASVGLYVWCLIGCCVVNVQKKREEFLLTIPLLVLVVGLWLGSPVFCEFRYAYPVMLGMPLIACVTVYEPQTGNGSHRK